ncbi:MAG: hypothetical protein HDR32_03580 [Treponema sp.]|nr:hypothetical protein [Treponema sp.]
MKRYAVLCGSAPGGRRQKNIAAMHDFLTSEEGGFWTEEDIMIFPNGVSGTMLSFVLERLRADGIGYIFLYVCPLSPVSDGDTSVWLGSEEVERRMIEDFCAGGGAQVVYDSCRETVDEAELCGEACANLAQGLRGFPKGL